MKKSILYLVAVVGLPQLSTAQGIAQGDPPFVSPAEQKVVDAQTEEFNHALEPLLGEAAKSTVRIWSGSRRLAYGTVVAGGRILTKWSEVSSVANRLRVEVASGDILDGKLAGIYLEEDLAVLDVSNADLKPVKWTQAPLKLGAFLVASQPNGEPSGSGVVSVLERNLREQDHAFLGVIGDLEHRGIGVRIDEVSAGSGADAAGLKPGNVILKVGDRTVSGVLELRNCLVGVSPGAKIDLIVDDGGREKTVKVLLGARPLLPKFPSDRLHQMEAMGGKLSRLADSFGRVIQTDMVLEPNEIGGPVVDIEGHVVGISVARAGRTRSYVMSGEEIDKVLKKSPRNPLLAQMRRPAQSPAIPQQRAPGMRRQQGRARPTRPVDPQRLKSDMEEMQQLLDFLQQEMNDLEEGR